MLKIYGYSDDIVCVERDGKPEAEYDAYDFNRIFKFDDGTAIEVGYGKGDKAIWFVHVIMQGTAKQQLTICEDENAEIYSDVFEIDEDFADYSKPFPPKR